MALSRYTAKGASVALLILSLAAVVASAQNNGIDPALREASGALEYN